MQTDPNWAVPYRAVPNRTVPCSAILVPGSGTQTYSCDANSHVRVQTNLNIVMQVKCDIFCTSLHFSGLAPSHAYDVNGTKCIDHPLKVAQFCRETTDLATVRSDLEKPLPELKWLAIRAVWLIECDYHAHLVSKAGSVIGTKSPSPAFKWSSS